MLRIVPHGSEMCMVGEVRKMIPGDRVADGRVVVLILHKLWLCVIAAMLCHQPGAFR